MGERVNSLASQQFKYPEAVVCQKHKRLFLRIRGMAARVNAPNRLRRHRTRRDCWLGAAMKPNFQGFVEPRMWPQDDGTRRDPGLDADHKPSSVVRYVGWWKCMRCGQLFWSEDVQC